MNEDQVQQGSEQPAESTQQQKSTSSPTKQEQSEVEQLYKDLNIKAKVPSAKPKKRPKADDGGDSKDTESDDASGKSGKGRQTDDSKDQSKATSNTSTDGAERDDSDTSSKEVGKKTGKDGEKGRGVSESGKEDESGVSEDEPSDNEEAGEASREDAETTDDSAGKRPGKSNPEVERRFQRLTEEKRERDERITELENQLRQVTMERQQEQVNSQDPEYTIDDFRRVQDEHGNVVDLDPEQAELAWRRWRDGYQQRAAERQAELHRQAELERQQQEYQQKVMQESTEAYDTLTNILESTPELDDESPEYDEQFAKEVMPIIQDLVTYQEGTEPGNPDGNQPVITGMKMNPKRMLDVISRIKNAKRNLPLNGLNDNVDTRSNVNVPHSRSSDPSVRQANDLYAELGIKKRL